MLIQILNSLHQYWRGWQGWVDHPPSQPCTDSTGTPDAWIWWRKHSKFRSFLGEEKSAHSLVDRSSGHTTCQTRKKAYLKPSLEYSIHWCGREDIERLRGTRIHRILQAYSNTFLCQHNELDLFLPPLWVWRVFWSVAAYPLVVVERSEKLH